MAKHGVEGVLDGDPREQADAKLIPELTHLQAIERGLKVMDTTALSLCMDNHAADPRLRARAGQHRPAWPEASASARSSRHPKETNA